MSGILEQLLLEQQKTNTILQAMLDAGQVVAVDKAVLPTVQEAPAEQDEEETPAVELDSQGVPWDVRIHSSNKKRYDKGANAGKWMKKRGVDAGEYEAITAKLLEGVKVANAQTAAIDSGNPIPSPTEVTEGLAPPPPAQNTGGLPAPAPATGGLPAPAPAAASTVDNVTICVDLITNLTTGWVADSGQFFTDGVSPEAINDYYSDQFGVKTFDDIDPKHYQQVISDLTDWQTALDSINATIKAILQVYATDTNVVKPYLTQSMCAYGNAGLIRHHELSTAQAKLKDLATQCNAAV